MRALVLFIRKHVENMITKVANSSSNGGLQLPLL